MGIMDKFDDLKDKAKDALGDHTDEVEDGVEKAADKVDDATGGKYGDQIDKGANAAKQGIDKLNQ